MAYEITDFEEDVIQRSFDVPVLVDFWAEWCGPCRVLSPILERLATESDGSWVLAKVNTEQHPDIAVKFRIQGIPNVKLFSQGKVIGEFVGALPEYAVSQWLKANVPGKYESIIRSARQLVKEGRDGEARSLVETVRREVPDHPEARVLLARLSLFDDPGKAGALVRDLEEPRLSDEVDAIHTFVRLSDLINQPDQLGQGAARQQYLAAAQDVQRQRFDAALTKFIALIREDRHYDDDGARKACVAIFKYLGEEHPITQKHRREFGNVLYV